MGKLSLALLAGCLAASSATAQLTEWPLQELPAKRHFSSVFFGGLTPVPLTAGLRIADLDGDGDMDLVPYLLGTVVVVENLRNVEFRIFWRPGPGDVIAPNLAGGDTAVGDLDGDGDLDLVLAGVLNSVWLNAGHLGFAQVQFPETFLTRAAVLGDVDGDGDLDLVLGEDGSQNLLFLNDGNGQFSDVTMGRMPVDTDSTSSAVLGDLDGDGDLDLVFGNGNESGPPGRDRLYLNDGRGTFSDATMALLPAVSARTEDLVLGDVDLDGDLDLVLGVIGQNRLYLNDGFGRMLDGTGFRLPVVGDATRDLSIADVDGDGDLDLVAANQGPNHLYLNDGVGGFSIDHSSALTGSADTKQVAAGDLDGDGHVDIVFGNDTSLGRGANQIYLNDGLGGFELITPTRIPSNRLITRAVAIADLDGDEDLDVVLGNQGGENGEPQNLLYVNDGIGMFEDQTARRMPVDAADTRAVAVADVDGDGDQDLLFGNGGPSPQNRLYLNDGSGRFVDGTLARLPVDGDETAAVAMGDVDGDGDPDVVLGSEGPSGGQNRLYLNDGTGVFTDATPRLPAVLDITTAVALVDVDGDADLDIVFGNLGQTRLCGNRGDGTFVDRTSALPQLDLNTYSLAVLDGDGDGDLDLVLGNVGPTNKVYENDGAGSFSDVTQAKLPGRVSAAVSLAVGDLDLDGDPDILFGHPGGGDLVTAGINHGTGAFTTWRFRQGYSGARSLALGDLDGDRDLDAVVGTSGGDPAGQPIAGRNQLLSNLHVQISTPFFPRLSATYVLEIRANRLSHDGSPYTIIPGLSVALAPDPLDLGSLGSLYLDTTRLILLPPVTLEEPWRPASVRIQIPHYVRLIGRTVHAQAVVISDSNPLNVRLTGYTADLIFR